MRLVNISNRNRIVYLFCRDDQGNQKIYVDKNFYPFFFEDDPRGEYISHDGIKLKKIVCQSPSEVPKMRSSTSYASDIRYTINYLIHKVKEITPCPMKAFYLDIEVLVPKNSTLSVDEMKKQAKYPISCITIYNSFSAEYKTFYLDDYVGDMKQKEAQLIKDTIDYFKEEKPDLWISWNCDFDYQYMHNRIPQFASSISPVGLVRAGKGEDIFFPAGISIIDQKGLYEKFTLNKKRWYNLDYIAQTDLGEAAWEKTDFSKLQGDLVKYKNINDVKRMVKLEEKYKIIPYFNEIRVFAKCLWEDLAQETLKKEGRLMKISNNSKIIDSLILQEAKEKNVIVPPKRGDGAGEESIEGAFRECYQTGRFANIAKFDLGSAYPLMITGFCLDPTNVCHSPLPNTIPVTIMSRVDKIQGETYFFKQNPDALLPSIVRKLIVIKDKLKKELGSLNSKDEVYENTKTKYNAIKSMVNSAYGVTANRFFRLFDMKVAESITFLVRDLIEYIKIELEKTGIKVLYVDTDSVFIHSKENIAPQLNKLVQKWAIEKYNNPNITIQFDFEGFFEKILILGKCHYVGYLRKKNGDMEKEIKGVEMKRSSSSKYEAYFQENLIEKLLDEVPRANILAWIKSEKERIKTLPMEEVAFPSKVPAFVKNVPIHVRAYTNSRELDPTFKLSIGELFYIVYVKSMGIDKNEKDINILGFTTEHNNFINRERIDWQEVIRRNIDNKANNLFEAMGWKVEGQPMVSHILEF